MATKSGDTKRSREFARILNKTIPFIGGVGHPEEELTPEEKDFAVQTAFPKDPERQRQERIKLRSREEIESDLRRDAVDEKRRRLLARRGRSSTILTEGSVRNPLGESGGARPVNRGGAALFG